MNTTYIDILTSNNLDEVIERSTARFMELVNPLAMCLLLWDTELHRYIVGETVVNDPQLAPSVFRRVVLSFVGNRVSVTQEHLHCLRLDDHDQHVGLVVYKGDRVLDSPEANLYSRCVGKALHINFRLAVAEREHHQLEADTKRLEHLLQAVEQQQRTIDRLLASEREWSAELERRVEAQVHALNEAQKRLIQSEKLAVIGKLASSLAHELNNPLQAIQSGIGLVIEDLRAGHIHQVELDLKVIEDELDRIQSIFRQMLDFYRPNQTERVPLDVNAICHDLAILMRKRLQRSNITLTLDLAEQLPVVIGDRNQIKQILINLMLNAAEAMDTVGGSVILKTASDEANVVITVADNGPGIPEEHLPHLFEPLFTTKVRGLGLGLSICEEIVKQHGGYIDVTTKVGVGTSFALQLPIYKEGTLE